MALSYEFSSHLARQSPRRVFFWLCIADARQAVRSRARRILWFGNVGLDVRAIRPMRRGLARQCLDWTERTHHLAGPPGVQFLRRLCDAGWMLRARDSRAVLVMPKGWQELHQRLGVDEATVRSEAEHRHA